MARQPASRRAAAAPPKDETPQQWTVSSPVEYPRKGGKPNEYDTVWCRCGSAFPLKNGEGFTILLNVLPTNGKLVLMPYTPEDDTAG